MTQLPTLELGEMELTWQEIMSITELQVSGVRGQGWGEGKAEKQGVWLGLRPGAGASRAQGLKMEMFQAL